MKIYDEYVMIRELGIANFLSSDDYMIIETPDGTKRINATDIALSIGNMQYYPTLNAMKADNNIKEGSIVRTLGYNYPLDGGGSTFYIVTDDSDTNNATIVALKNQNLRAFLIDQEVRPEQFGAIGDGENDDSNAIQIAINTGRKLIFNSNAIYKVNKLSINNNHNIDFNNCILKDVSLSMKSLDGISINNLRIESIRDCMHIKDCSNIKLNNIDILSGSNIRDITFSGNCHNIFFNNIHITNGIGIYILNENSDNNIIDGIVFDNATFDRVQNVINTYDQNNKCKCNITLNNISISNCKDNSDLFELQQSLITLVVNNIIAKDCNNSLFYINNENAIVFVSNIYTSNLENIYDLQNGVLHLGGNNCYLSDNAENSVFKDIIGTLYKNSLMQYNCKYISGTESETVYSIY